MESTRVTFKVFGEFEVLKFVARLASTWKMAIKVSRAIARPQQTEVFLKI